ncbi:DUF2304 family protein [Bacillus thuringiensis]|uniref:DUF2304 family protein n=1 Tax=Bacillus thuringiensis TaxID=1428 RepID=UPI003CC802F2
MPIITFSFIFILLLFFLIINSIRRDALETKYSLLWIFVCIAMAVLSFTDKIINWEVIARRIPTICFILIRTFILLYFNF